MTSERLIIGTRGSQLALWQAHHVADALRSAWPGLEVELTIIRTSGDRIQDRLLREIGGKGLFVKEIEEALLEGSIDLAVHSMKDVPAEFPEGLGLAALLERASPFDALITRSGADLDGLPAGAAVGTGALRRQFQLLAARPDLRIVPIRGNVDTRLRKLAEGEDGLEAILLAVSGLTRLGWADQITAALLPPRFLPAIGQGALGLETRLDDARVRAFLAPLRHPDTEACVAAERGVLERLEGGCHLPIACYGRFEADTLRLTARLGSPDGARIIEADATHPRLAEPRAVGIALAERLLADGGAELLASLTP